MRLPIAFGLFLLSGCFIPVEQLEPDELVWMSQEIKLKVAGLYSQPSLIGEDIPEGAMVTADNIAIRREGIIEPRRGVSAYATLAANRITSYQDKLITHSSTGTVSYDNGSGTFTALTGSFPPVSSTTAKTRFAQAAQDLFFTTSTGVYRMDAYNSIPLAAGAIKATGFERDSTLYSSTAGNMSLTSNVVSVTTTADHGFYVGQVVTMMSVTEGAHYVNGNHTVLTVPSATSFTYAQVAANDAGNANTHTFMPAALDTAGGFLTDGNQVAYRVVFNCPDANNTEKQGSASPRFVVTNSSGTPGWVTAEARNTIVRVLVPSGVTTSHIVRLYRSKQVANTIEPEDELQLVWEALVKTNEVARGWLDIADVAPDALRGAIIYIAPSKEGIAQNNDRPPIAKDLATFGGAMHYANTTPVQRQTINILAVGGAGGIQNGEAFVVTMGATTEIYFAQTTPTATNHFKLETGGTVSANIRNTALSLVAMINRATASVVSAYYVSGPNDLPGKIMFEAKALGSAAFTLYISSSVAAKRGAWSPFANALLIGVDLARVGSTVTATNTSGSFVSFVVGESVDIAPGNANFPAGTKTVVSVSGTTFTYTESGSAVSLAGQGASLTKVISSTAEPTGSRVYHSKTNLPESVPLLNFHDIGSKDAEILRIVALRDSIFAFKEDGLFRGTGDNGSFQWRLFDPTIILVAPDSVQTLGNQIYALTTQGVVSISDTGSEIVSRPIEKTLLGLFATDFSKVQTSTFAIGYESDRSYELRTISSAGEPYSTQAFIFNTITRAWVRDNIVSKCGIIHPLDDKRYLGGLTQILKERKDLTYADYSDADISTNINSFDIVARTITLSTAVADIGDVITDGNGEEALVIGANGSVITYGAADDEAVGVFITGAAAVKRAFTSTVQWAPIVGKNPGASKMFRETTMLMGNAHVALATESHSTELVPTFTDTSINGSTAAGQWVSASAPWDGIERPYNLRLITPQEMRRATRLNLKWSVRNSWAAWNISGVSVIYESGSSRVSR